jgi:hypothetical protein
VQRQELIGSPDFSQRQRKIASEQDALLGAQDVTASLRRTKQLMAQNLEQTHGNISVIGEGDGLGSRYLGECSDLVGCCAVAAMCRSAAGVVFTGAMQCAAVCCTCKGGCYSLMHSHVYIQHPFVHAKPQHVSLCGWLFCISVGPSVLHQGVVQLPPAAAAWASGALAPCTAAYTMP